ncbi:glycine cleavage system aminomethyltransferase GcvT [Streptomyces sp. NPDC020681]|uniref:glycine cleavage system aminomethyltransferase GcvT n=1 Tax=Streptomyces sp. NPDC020681 TaxID=3365083 RepID=UPI0037B7B359
MPTQPDAPLRTTPLDAVHRRLGATTGPFAGWEMPMRYGNEREEHIAVRTKAGLFDLFHTGEITVSGIQAAEALDHALVGNISALATGRALYTMICAENGGILDDLIVYRTGEREYLVAANARNAETVLAELTARAAPYPGAKVRDDRDTYALVAIQGPEAAAIIAPLAGVDLEYYGVRHGTVAGTDALIARTGYTGEDGFELYVAAEAAEAMWNILTEAGTSHGLVPAGMACRDTLRLEAGMPRYGHELTPAITPFDAGRGHVVHFNKTTNKGRFIGRDALIRAAEAAHKYPLRKLVGLVSTGEQSPRTGFPVVNKQGAKVGEVTSGALSPTLVIPIAIAYLETAHAETGTHVAVNIHGKHERYKVVALPFYRRPSAPVPASARPKYLGAAHRQQLTSHRPHRQPAASSPEH